MDSDVGAQFIAHLTKSLQTVIHSYMEFEANIELGGYIYLKVDNADRIDYVLSEKMLKSNLNSVTFRSNSFHALPQSDSEGSSKPSNSRDKTISTGSSDSAGRSAGSGHVHSRSSSESPVYSTTASASGKAPYQNIPLSGSQHSDTFTHPKGVGSNDFQISPGSMKIPSNLNKNSTSTTAGDSFRSNNRSLTDFQTAFRNPPASLGSQIPQSSPAHSWNPSHNGSNTARPSASHTSQQQQQQSKSGILPDPSDMEVVHIKTEEEDDVFNIPLQCSQGGSESDGFGMQGKPPWLAMRMRQPFYFPYPRLARSQSFDQRMNMARSNPRFPYFSGESSSDTASLTCKVCGKGYRSRQGLLFHERAKHQNVFNVYCPVCGKGFQQTTHMYGHMATHTNIKNFQCQACGAKYAHKTSLQQHLRSGSCRAAGMNSPAGLDLSTSQPFRDFSQYNDGDASQLRPSPGHSQSQSPLESTNSSLGQPEADAGFNERRLPSFSQTNQLDSDLDGCDQFDMPSDKTGRQNLSKELPAGSFDMADDEPMLDQGIMSYENQPGAMNMHGLPESGGVVFPEREESRGHISGAEIGRGLNLAGREGTRASPSPQASGVDMTKDTHMYDTGSAASVCQDVDNRHDTGYDHDSDVPETVSLSLSADDD